MDNNLKKKFRKSVGILVSTVTDNKGLLYHTQPKLYKKLFKFYEEQGVEFTGDPSDDYRLIMELLREDLQEDIAKRYEVEDCVPS